MKDRLVAIYNVFLQIETKGESTLMMADCIRELHSIIDILTKEEITNDREDS